MGNRKFSTPIYLVLSGLGNFRADSAWECFEYLDLHWPGARTADYRRAKALCRVAVDGGVPPEQARRAVATLARHNSLLAAGPGTITSKQLPSRFTPVRAWSGPLGPRTIAALTAGGAQAPHSGDVTPP